MAPRPIAPSGLTALRAVLEPPTTPTLAGLGKRIAARLIDWTILIAVGFVLTLVFGEVRWGEPFIVPEWLRVTNLLLSVVYEVLLVALTGQTIGKRLLGVRVVDATTGALPDLGQAGRRALPNIVGLVPYLGSFAPLLYLRALYHPRRQGFHDAFASTIVVTV